ncbi:MAG: hypothetical protein IJN51_06340 [Alistipes sp.]|nr:hypothetical protein [Alistipes sp.]MBQ6940898.1 hypothetical protein [Alistipes sp.]
MKLYNYLIAALATLTIACAPEAESPKEYPALATLDNTMWYSYDQKTNTYYDIWYDGEGRGRMLGYDTQERENEIVNRPFDYTFEPANDIHDGVVRVNFDDGIRYGGPLIPKGTFQINNTDVYFIQLYEVDEEGNVIYDLEGHIKSAIQMWKE